MRKYFLISAVAIIVANTVNAVPNEVSSSLTASANIIYLTTISCSELNFGTIMLKNDTQEATVTLNNGSEDHSDNVHSVDGYAESVCTSNLYIDAINSFSPDNITLTNSSSDVELPVVLNHYTSGGKFKIGGTLTIPERTPRGNYSATVTIFTIFDDSSSDPT